MAKIDVPVEILEQFCRKNRIRKLSLFGSVLRNDFRQESDSDLPDLLKSIERILK